MPVTERYYEGGGGDVVPTTTPTQPPPLVRRPKRGYIDDDLIKWLMPGDAVDLYYSLMRWEPVSGGCPRLVAHPVYTAPDFGGNHALTMAYEQGLQKRIYDLRGDLHYVTDPTTGERITGLFPIHTIITRPPCELSTGDQILKWAITAVAAVGTMGASFAITAVQIAVSLGSTLTRLKAALAKAEEYEGYYKALRAGVSVISEIHMLELMVRSGAVTNKLLYEEAVLTRTSRRAWLMAMAMNMPHPGMVMPRVPTQNGMPLFVKSYWDSQPPEWQLQQRINFASWAYQEPELQRTMDKILELYRLENMVPAKKISWEWPIDWLNYDSLRLDASGELVVDSIPHVEQPELRTYRVASYPELQPLINYWNYRARPWPFRIAKEFLVAAKPTDPAVDVMVSPYPPADFYFQTPGELELRAQIQQTTQTDVNKIVFDQYYWKQNAPKWTLFEDDNPRFDPLLFQKPFSFIWRAIWKGQNIYFHPDRLTDEQHARVASQFSISKLAEVAYPTIILRIEQQYDPTMLGFTLLPTSLTSPATPVTLATSNFHFMPRQKPVQIAIPFPIGQIHASMNEPWRIPLVSVQHSMAHPQHEQIG